jgi:hypothetical protein
MRGIPPQEPASAVMLLGSCHGQARSIAAEACSYQMRGILL